MLPHAPKKNVLRQLSKCENLADFPIFCRNPCMSPTDSLKTRITISGSIKIRHIDKPVGKGFELDLRTCEIL